jgi:hypothetical protein
VFLKTLVFQALRAIATSIFRRIGGFVKSGPAAQL